MRSREMAPSRDLYALVFVHSRVGRQFREAVEGFLELGAARSENILRRAFLGDPDMRAIVEACWGPVDWVLRVEETEAR